MGQIIKTIIKDFTGGIANDVRDPRKDKCRMVTNFDISSSTRMTPYRDSVDGDSGSATSQKQNFAIALRTGTTYSLYALGVKSGVSTAEIQYKNLSTGAATDLDDATWTETANYQSSAGATDFNLFVYYKKTGLIYGARAGTHIWSYAPDGSGWTDSAQAVTYTNMAQGIVHSKDDILYIPYDNYIASKNGAAAFNLTALTLPTHLKINSICEYGNYLAIGAAPLSGIGNSIVYLWDRDSSLATLSESIDWGTGELKVLEEINGYLVGISLQGNIASVNEDRIIFRYLLGNKSKKYDELVADTGSTTTLNIAKQKINNRVYFMLRIEIDNQQRDGVWSFGFSLIEPTFTVVHERTPDDDTALSGGVLKNFFIVGDYMFQTFVNASSAYQTTKTNHLASYTATSIREKLFNTVDSQTTKKLLGVSVTFADLPTNAQVVLKYKIDENIPSNTWVTVFTHATASSIRHTATNIESTGATLPTYKEIMFRIESTKGAEITGLKFLEETIDDDLLKI